MDVKLFFKEISNTFLDFLLIRYLVILMHIFVLVGNNIQLETSLGSWTHISSVNCIPFLDSY